MKTYLFYDIESTGLSKPFDQVLQFAAIRTDLAFNEISRHEIMVKLNPDLIPSPYAFITHQIPLNDLKDGISELSALEEIHQIMNEPGTISLGYNTLGFDDEFLRFSFYRNLLTPYTHQYANQCSRMDIFPMTVMYFLYKKEVLEWPMIDGKISLKLENLSKANQLAEGAAHDAMVDVLATLALAKKLAQEKEMWAYLCAYFNKHTDSERLLKLPKTVGEHREGLMILSKLGAANCFQTPVLHLGTHHTYKNQIVWLRLDLPGLRKMTQKSIEESTWVINKKLAEPGFVLPLNERFSIHLSEERSEEMKKNKEWLEKNPNKLSAITEHYLNYTYPLVPNTDVDSALYITDFWTAEDVDLCQHFHKATPEEKAAMIGQMRNPHLKAMAIRLIGRHFPSMLSASQQEEFEHYRLKALSNHPPVDHTGKSRYSKQQCLNDIIDLRQSDKLNNMQQELLNQLEQRCYEMV